jgi:type IV pilus assembly protein PilQ
MGVSDSVRTGGELLSSNGTDFTFGARSINDFLSRIGTGSFNLGRVSPNFYVRLRALENNNNVEMRSVPKLSTLNGHSAVLSIGSSRFYSVSTQNQIGSLTPQNIVTQQFNEIKAATTIKIKPIVSGDEQVTLNITVDISDFTQDTPINQPPPTSTSKFESIIRIRNEETVVLGGIERYENAETGGGVPLLSRIPVLKWIFSNKTKSKNKVVSVVFIKPTIIYQ